MVNIVFSENECMPLQEKNKTLIFSLKMLSFFIDYGRNKYTDCLAIKVEDWSKIEKRYFFFVLIMGWDLLLA